MLTVPLHYIGASSIYFFRVGLCPHENYLCRTRGATRGVRFDREDERLIDPVDLSPRDHQSRHVLKNRISERDQRTYMRTPGSTRSVQSASRFHHASVGVHRTVAIFCDFMIGEHRKHPISIVWTTLDSSRVHDWGDRHRTVDRNPHQEDRKAHLLTRGLKWCIRSSSNAQSRSAVRSPSDGPESPRSPLTTATHGTHRSAGSPSDDSG